MKRILPIMIILLSVALFIAGCNIGGTDNKATTASTATVTQTSQGNSKLITLAPETTTKSAKKKLVYYSQNIGASFSIPLKWENKYAVEDSVSDDGSRYVSFFDKVNHSNNGKGLVFTYNLFVTDKYKSKSNYTEYGTVVTEDNTTYYVVRTTPKKIQYNAKSEGLKKSYEALCQQKYIDYICNSVIFDIGVTLDKTGCSTAPSSTATAPTDENGETVSATEASKAPSRGGVNGLVISDISTRKLTENEVKSLSKEQVQQAINDICALNGYDFLTKSIKEHYMQFSWYKPSKNYSESNFSAIERYNYDLLQKYR